MASISCCGVPENGIGSGDAVIVIGSGVGMMLYIVDYSIDCKSKLFERLVED
jgi:hypothetical protein